VSEPLREQIMIAVVELLKTMTGDRPGLDGTPWGQYPNDPIVERGYKDESQVNQCPALFVSKWPGSSVVEKTTAGGMVGVEHTFQFAVYGYTKNAGNVPAGVWLERLWDDVYTTLMKNWTLGGICQQLRFEGEDDYDEDEIKAGFRQGVVAILYESKAIE